MLSATTEVVNIVNKKKPKMKADVRRAAMIHSLSTRMPHNQPTPGPDFLRERAALRLRTLRTFFCCRSFSTVFFISSHKQEERTHSTFSLDHLEEDDALSLTAASEKPRCLELTNENAHFGTVKRLLLIGQADVHGLNLGMFSFTDATPNTFCRWAEVLSLVEQLAALDEIAVNVPRNHKSPWIVHMLREFLPPKISRFSSTCIHDFLIPAHNSKPTTISKTLCLFFECVRVKCNSTDGSAKWPRMNRSA
ncbi:hypothetical protein M3Y99_02000600 [Aphelenchoides fujianensis]|nr:hypothetical protein M3Y99_02000600 [Aphelenchoides fujianensis]